MCIRDRDTASFWGEILQIVHTHTERVESEGVNTEIFNTGKGKIELLNSISEDSPIRKFLENIFKIIFINQSKI